MIYFFLCLKKPKIEKENNQIKEVLFIYFKFGYRVSQFGLVYID